MKGYVINLDSRPDRLELFRKNEFPFEVERVPGVVASCGQDGCTQAHINVLSMDHEYPFVVFEDDCMMLEPWSFVEEVMKQIPIDQWDAIWLGAMLKVRLTRATENLYRLKRAYALHGVIYNSPKMVDFILNHHNTSPGTNLDVFYRYVVQDHFKCYIIKPLVATQRAGYNNVAVVYADYEQEILRRFKEFVV